MSGVVSSALFGPVSTSAPSRCDRADHAAGTRAGVEHFDRSAAPLQLERRGEPGDAGADDDDVDIGRCRSELIGVLRRRRRQGSARSMTTARPVAPILTAGTGPRDRRSAAKRCPISTRARRR